MPDTRPGLDALRERVIREITVAPGWNKPDATALVDELLAAADWTIKRLAQALRVASHTPHDQASIDPESGFPVCSVCGAIQTALASPATGDSRPDASEAVYDALKPHFIRAGLSEDQFRAAWEAGRNSRPLHAPQCMGFDSPSGPCAVTGWSDSRQSEGLRPTHGRHCPCSACAREDWTNPNLAPCGMHGPSCPPGYAPPRLDRRTGPRDRRTTPAEESSGWDGQLRRRGVLDRRGTPAAAPKEEPRG